METLEFFKCAPFAHVPGHHQQDCAQSRQWDVTRKGRCQQHDGGKCQRMNDPCDWGSPARSHIRYRACNSSSCGDPAKKWAHQIGNALGHQFLIGVMTIINHPVGHAGAEQGLNGAEQSNRKGWRNQLPGRLPLQYRERGQW